MPANTTSHSPVKLPAALGGLTVAEILERLETVVRDLRDLSAARVVFGTPVVAEGRTVIPVAKFGGGLGGSLINVLQRLATKGPQVISGGGGLSAEPIGYIDISAEGTTFVPIAQGLQRESGTNTVKESLPFLVGLLVGTLTPHRKT